MKGDFTRFTFDRKKHYSGIRMQQGRIQLDSDWNELGDIQAYRMRTESEDFIGPSGAPKLQAGFGLAVTDNNLTISAGRMYVDGILCENGIPRENEEPVPITDQPDLPGYELPTEDGLYLAYLEVWDRHITALEDAGLREMGLGGPDTATRIKTVWQVKLHKVEEESATEHNERFTPDWLSSEIGTLKAHVKAENSGQLRNALYRVEIHDVDDDGNVFIKWARDNASTVFRWQSLSGKELTVAGSDQAAAMDVRAGQWVELTDDKRELRNWPGVLVEVDRVDGNVLTLKSEPVIEKYEGYDLKVRRWNSVVELENDNWIPLEDGIEVQLTGPFRAGDYWLIPARSFNRGIEWPSNEAALRPHGIERHYSRLALVERTDDKLSVKKDYRFKFSPLSDIPALMALQSAPKAPVGTIYVDDAGNVGIGTTEPGSVLHLKGNSGSQVMSLVVQDTLANAPKLWRLGNDGQQGKFGLMDGSYKNYRWIVDSEGRVGIGTPDPGQRLTVNGNVDIQGFGHIASYDGVATITSEMYSVPLRLKAREGNAPDLVVATDGNVGIGTQNPNAKLEVAGSLLATGGATIHGVANVDGGLTVTGAATVAGRNVGADGANLDTHVARRDNPHGVTLTQLGAVSVRDLTNHKENKENPHGVTLAQLGAAGADTHMGRRDNPHGVTLAQLGAAGADTHMGRRDNPHGVTLAQLQAASAAELTNHKENKDNPHNVTLAQLGALSTSGGTITDKLGIGTIPQHSFHVVEQETSPDWAAVFTHDKGSSTVALCYADGSGVAIDQEGTWLSAYALWVLREPDTETTDVKKTLFRVGNDGKVSVGTRNPIQELDIRGRMNLENGVIQRGGLAITNTSDLGLYSQVNGNWIRIVTKGAPITFFTDGGTGGTIQMIIDPAGNVGIGTPNPGGDRLDVRGRCYSSGGWALVDSDYAELFESESGDSIPVGTTVVLGENGKIRPAKEGETPIGVISPNGAILGNSYKEWPGKYLRDPFRSLIMEEYREEIMIPKRMKVAKERQKVEKRTIEEDVSRTEVVLEGGKYYKKLVTERVRRDVEEPVFEEVDLYDPDGGLVVGKHRIPVMETHEEEVEVLDDEGRPVLVGSGKFVTKERPKLNPEYDETKAYTLRGDRPEWNSVGLLGQLALRKGQPVAPDWVKMQDITDEVDLWLVK